MSPPPAAGAAAWAKAEEMNKGVSSKGKLGTRAGPMVPRPQHAARRRGAGPRAAPGIVFGAVGGADGIRPREQELSVRDGERPNRLRRRCSDVESGRPEERAGLPTEARRALRRSLHTKMLRGAPTRRRRREEEENRPGISTRRPAPGRPRNIKTGRPCWPRAGMSARMERRFPKKPGAFVTSCIRFGQPSDPATGRVAKRGGRQSRLGWTIASAPGGSAVSTVA